MAISSITSIVPLLFLSYLYMQPSISLISGESSPLALIWASRTLRLIVLTSAPEESDGLMSLLIPVICHSRKARATGEHP